MMPGYISIPNAAAFAELSDAERRSVYWAVKGLMADWALSELEIDGLRYTVTTGPVEIVSRPE